MLSNQEFKAKWSSLHSDAETKGIVGAWLNISYRFGLICTLLRISPNALTYLGLFCQNNFFSTSETTYLKKSFDIARLFYFFNHENQINKF
jgi:CDP-diacylglycerol--glycerol-3-phosphate 3-phosphatidyltransferase